MTAPRTWVAGETVTAALLNTELRDRLTYGNVAAKNTASVVTVGGAALTVLTAPAVTGDGAKRFKVTVQMPDLLMTVNTDQFDFTISRGATAIRQQRVYDNLQRGLCFSASDVPATGSTVYVLTCTRSAGTGTLTVYGDNAGTGWTPEIIVEQVP